VARDFVNLIETLSSSICIPNFMPQLFKETQRILSFTEIMYCSLQIFRFLGFSFKVGAHSELWSDMYR